MELATALASTDMEELTGLDPTMDEVWEWEECITMALTLEAEESSTICTMGVAGSDLGAFDFLSLFSNNVILIFK